MLFVILPFSDILIAVFERKNSLSFSFVISIVTLIFLAVAPKNLPLSMHQAAICLTNVDPAFASFKFANFHLFGFLSLFEIEVLKDYIPAFLADLAELVGEIAYLQMPTFFA